ncbi:hypothetical protein GETHPA_10400 [Geothrix rubra]|uniref:Uncharacterized protein n=1 Tax=Geothrix rubra TaxID=2927977 RepID=A0ABQ5Q490_9BACT|nr:hypothetical protein [Geothrix rubra]GLH69507.1 hypothetical protein GETHPA_10400 [Geothrix rubra]
MTTSWDDTLGLALDLVRTLRAAGDGAGASALLAALTAGCSAPELALALREAALELPEPLAAPVRERRDALLSGLRDVLGG